MFGWQVIRKLISEYGKVMTKSHNGKVFGKTIAHNNLRASKTPGCSFRLEIRLLVLIIDCYWLGVTRSEQKKMRPDK